MTPQEKLKKIREELRQTFLERADLIDGALAALLSAHHVLIVGPPGTAKSMLADEICRRIEGANYFQWLLTRFTTPEEIFGAVSLKALEQDDYRRVTDHKLPQAHIAFLDEIFKANSSILNAILTLINERLFHNGKEVAPVPLLTLFGASNELPEEEELTALYDRFLVRFVVNYIAEDFRFLRIGAAFERTERVAGARSEYCHPVPRIPKYRRHSASAQQKKHPSVGPPLSTVTVLTPGARLPRRTARSPGKGSFLPRTCSLA